MRNENVPEIRFPGFVDVWEDYKLRDFSRMTYGGGTPKTDIKEFWDGNVPWIQSSDLSNDELFDIHVKKFISEKGIQNSATKYIPENSIAIVTRVGVGKLLYMPFPYATSQDFLSLSELTVDSFFALYSIHRVLSKELNNIQGTSIKGITKNDLLDKDTIIPLNKEEQVKIGRLFKDLDSTITFQKQNINNLKQTKQGFLQKMFPKEGESVPELRFPGFTDGWEQRKLGEVTRYIKGLAFKSKDYKENGIRIIRVSDLGRDKIKNTNDTIFVSKEIAEINRKYKINKNEIIITTVGSKAEMKESAVGRPIIVNEEEYYLLNQNLVKITSYQEQDNYFIYAQLLQPRYTDYVAMIQRGNANQANIAIGDLWEYPIFISKSKEQQKIGQFFKQLDDTIALHQRELDLLKQTKKAFLQKMFI